MGRTWEHWPMLNSSSNRFHPCHLQAKITNTTSSASALLVREEYKYSSRTIAYSNNLPSEITTLDSEERFKMEVNALLLAWTTHFIYWLDLHSPLLSHYSLVLEYCTQLANCPSKDLASIICRVESSSIILTFSLIETRFGYSKWN